MMSRDARIWIGLTLLIVLAFNYAIIGFPLYRKAANLHDRSTTMLMKQIKSGNALNTSAEEDYILEIFRREKAAIDRKLIVLNAISLTFVVLAASWTLFGLAMNKKK